MVDFAPFRAARQAHKKSDKDISSFVCPPYDVISPHERESFAKRAKPNVIELELPLGTFENKYINAERILKTWRDTMVLQDDRVASFYLLETTFQISDAFAPKKPMKRYGVLGGLRLETPGKGAVHPHEKTLPKAKEDRLYLLNALRTNVSPIFGLFFDTKKQWGKWVAKATKKTPLVQGRESKTLSHRLWKIDSEPLQKELRALIKPKDLYIADGHHRYEVAWAYKESRLSHTADSQRSDGFHFAMTYICPMEETGLLMLPTHRLVKTSRSVAEWERHLSNVFQMTPAKNMDAIIKAVSDKKSRTIGWANQKGLFLLKLRADISIDRCLQHRPEALRELDVVLLHDLALGEVSEPSFMTDKEIVFTRDLHGLEALPKKDAAWVGFVLGSPGVESLARVAGANEVMPPKTTYFYPKVPTGFTLMPLDQQIF